jgi:hypothetical protein
MNDGFDTVHADAIDILTLPSEVPVFPSQVTVSPSEEIKFSSHSFSRNLVEIQQFNYVIAFYLTILLTNPC